MASPICGELQWASLPSDLKELVLAQLSRATLLSVRSVSREWLTILSSSHFHHLHRRLHPRSYPALLVYNHAVKISACDWRPPLADNISGSIPQSASPLLDADPCVSWRDLSLPTIFVREWVGAGALICVRNHLTANAFSVGCPFSNQWKALPNPLRAPLLSKLWAIVPHISTKAKIAFSVLLLQLNSPSVYLDVYSSEGNQWVRRCLPATAVSFSSLAACVGGLVYSVQADSRSVVTYDVVRDLWKALEAKLPSNLVFQIPTQGGLVQTIPHITEGYRGKVLLVGAASNAQNDISLAQGDIDADIMMTCDGEIVNYAVVWELDWSRKEWREMARAPSDMCAHMIDEAMDSHKAAVTPVKYTGHAELVVAMVSGSQRALQFDVIEEKWAWLDLPSAVNCDLTLCLQPKTCMEPSSFHF